MTVIFVSQLSFVTPVNCVETADQIEKPFWATVCKTVRPMLSVRCLSCPVLSVLSVLSVTFVHCGQTVGRIKMKLGMQVGLGPWSHCVRWGPSSPSPKGHSPFPIFGPFLLWSNGWMNQDVTWYGLGLGPGDFVLDGDPAPPSPKEGGRTPQIFGPCLL